MTINSFWTLDRLAGALAERGNGNHPCGAMQLHGVTTDTRSIQTSDVFLALKGERFDGHDYLQEAVDKGASALVVSSSPRINDTKVPVYLVDDTLLALGDIARYWRRAWNKTVVAVAGSNGKTSTKDLIKAALTASYSVHATTGNLNNRIGVPLTLLAMTSEADIAVIELGTSLPGEVAILRDIAEPQISVVTSVAEEHLEGLGDLAGVLREETACFNNVDVAIIPAAQPEIGEAARLLAKRVVAAGLDSGDVAPSSWSMRPDGSGIIEIDGISVHVPLKGAHNLRNAMLAIAVAKECGVPIQEAAVQIAGMPTPKMRVSFEKVGSVTVINDAYNANPGSARAALELLQTIPASGQRVAILGTMRELGAISNQLHDEIAIAALSSGADIVAGIGDFAGALSRTANGDARVVTAREVEELWPLLEPRLRLDATILLKASRGVKLERILTFITDWANKAC